MKNNWPTFCSSEILIHLHGRRFDVWEQLLESSVNVTLQVSYTIFFLIATSISFVSSSEIALKSISRRSSIAASLAAAKQRKLRCRRPAGSSRETGLIFVFKHR